MMRALKKFGEWILTKIATCVIGAYEKVTGHDVIDW